MSFWIVAGAAIALAAVLIPLVAIIVVSWASLREEATNSLSGEAPGPCARLARRVLGFRAAHVGAFAPTQTTTRSTRRDTEVRFQHARRSLSDSSKHSASRQSPSDRIRADFRQRASV